MGLKQQQVGKSFEDEVMEVYTKKGYLCEKLKTGLNGTCYDINVSRGTNIMRFECKHTNSDKLQYKGSGIFKKRDELNRLYHKYNIDVFIIVKSEIEGCGWLNWSRALPIFESKGYLDFNDLYRIAKESMI